MGAPLSVSLGELSGLLESKGILVSAPDATVASNVLVTGADCDSRVAREGHLFICKGRAFRADFLVAAVDAGAVAYLCDEDHADALAEVVPDVPALVTSDIRRAMAIVSPVAWGHPDRELPTVGVTGTKGKSTVTCMLRAMVDEGSERPLAGLMGSIDTFDGVEHFESVNTTPEPPDLWRHLANALKSELSCMVMEVSSHALKYDRVLGLDLDVACFLNIGRDHISPIEHPDFEDYFASKLRIFGQCKTAVVNLDTDRVDEVLEAAKECEKLVSFSAAPDAEERGADIWARDIVSREGEVSFVAHGRGWERKMTIPMPGLFNVDNALAAIACGLCIGLDPAQMAAGLAHASVPGRMELIKTRDPRVCALVDYAHNELSFRRFFASVAQEFEGRQVIALFGAPGDKAQERRRVLPEEASRWSDLLIYTEEDPAHEEVADICAEMARATPEGQAYEVICDRPEAIARAVEVAAEAPNGAVVCLLAKGDETRQHRGDLFVPCEPDGEIFRRVAEQVLGGGLE